LAALSRNLLRDQVLHGVEPNNLTRANLSASIDKLGVSASKREYLRLWEFCTGLSPEFPLSGGMRWFSEVRDYGFQRSALRGRRALLMQLPPQWDKQGLFEIVGFNAEDSSVSVRQRFTMETAQIQVQMLPPFNEPSQLSVDHNWSETDAQVVSSKMVEGEGRRVFKLANLFCNHIVSSAVPGSSATWLRHASEAPAHPGGGVTAAGGRWQLAGPSRRDLQRVHAAGAVGRAGGHLEQRRMRLPEEPCGGWRLRGWRAGAPWR